MKAAKREGGTHHWQLSITLSICLSVHRSIPKLAVVGRKNLKNFTDNVVARRRAGAGCKFRLFFSCPLGVPSSDVTMQLPHNRAMLARYGTQQPPTHLSCTRETGGGKRGVGERLSIVFHPILPDASSFCLPCRLLPCFDPSGQDAANGIVVHARRERAGRRWGRR